jgi:hypothetical protein
VKSDPETPPKSGIFSAEKGTGRGHGGRAARSETEVWTMVRVMLEDADYCDVPADLMTFEDGIVVFWRDGEEVGRHRQVRIRALEVLGSRLSGRRIEETRKNYPNAYRSWTQEQEDLLTELYKNEATKAELVNALGRQPGGIETRLRSLGLLSEDEKLR